MISNFDNIMVVYVIWPNVSSHQCIIFMLQRLPKACKDAMLLYEAEITSYNTLPTDFA